MPQQQILGIQRVLQTNTAGQTWNNKKLCWSIVHNFDNQSKPYDIELQMVLVSSKRIVKVNQQLKDMQMCSFGYEAKFDISDRLNAEIKQDSLTFQLFVNGKSFTELQEKNNAYEPPKIDVEGNGFWEKPNNHDKNLNLMKDINFKTFKQPQQMISSKSKPSNITTSLEPKKTLSQISKQKSTQFNFQQLKQEAPSLQLRHKPFSVAETIKEKKETQNVIKDTQSELMKILMEEKKRKKQQEQKLKMNQ